jgi:hypothetical protein
LGGKSQRLQQDDGESHLAIDRLAQPVALAVHPVVLAAGREARAAPRCCKSPLVQGDLERLPHVLLFSFNEFHQYLELIVVRGLSAFLCLLHGRPAQDADDLRALVIRIAAGLAVKPVQRRFQSIEFAPLELVLENLDAPELLPKLGG